MPAEAGFQGTVRYFHREDGDLAAERFRTIVEQTAAAYGIAASVDWDDFQDPLVSDPALIEPVCAHIPQYASLAPIMPSMAGEDFAEYAKVTRPVFAFVGSNGTRFVGFDETVRTGADFYANSALDVLDALRVSGAR